jgi:hypothetical protein
MIRLKDLLFEQVRVGSGIYRTPAITTTLANLQTAAQNYNPPNVAGYIRISNGNIWLAQQRANALSTFLSTNLFQSTEIQFNQEQSTISQVQVLGPEASNQRTSATIQGRMKKDIPEVRYAYDLLYNFYEVDGVPHIVVTKLGAGAPKLVNKDSFNQNKERYINDFIKPAADALNTGIAVFQGIAGGTGNMGILVPLPKNYAEKKGSRLYFNSEEDLNNMRAFIQKYTQDNDEFTTDRPENKNANYLSSNWTKTQGGGGNYIFGKESGANATVLTGPNKDKTVTIKRTYRTPTGQGKGIVPGTGETEWKDLGTIELAPTTFPANMITIQQGAYQTILDQIKQLVIQNQDLEFKGAEIRATIQGYASSLTANNRAASGVTPDHTWGNRIQMNQWITP